MLTSDVLFLINNYSQRIVLFQNNFEQLRKKFCEQQLSLTKPLRHTSAEHADGLTDDERTSRNDGQNGGGGGG